MKLQFITYFFIAAGLIITSKTIAQADISMSTHWYNRANYNPASIARTDYLYLFSNMRQQWIGVDGAPKVFNFQASEYIHSLRSAFGFSLIGENIGATQVLNTMATYTYRLSHKQDWAFSMGLSAGVFSRILNGTLFEADNINDPSISNKKEKKIAPDFNIGFEFQNNHFIFGCSSTHLYSIFNPSNTLLNTNHRYGYIIYNNSQLRYFNYNIGLQTVNRQNLTIIEGNFNLRFKRQTGLIKGAKEIFDLGFTYRSSKQITLITGFNINSDVKIGYAYDQTLRAEYNRNGTHEIIFEWRIPQKSASTRFKCGNNTFWYH